MKCLIDKAALVAEIERKINEVNPDNIEDWRYRLQRERDIGVMKSILSLINTLEVKEVDLEQETQRILDEHFFYPEEDDELKETPKLARYIAKHFFKLGVRVNNPITAADRGTAEEIIINLKRVEQDYRINLTKEMEWLRNKVKKGE